MKNHTKIFWFMTFHIKLWLVQNLCVLDLTRNGFIRVYDGTRYLVLFGPEKYDVIYNRIRYMISQKSGITYVISHNYGGIKVDTYDSLKNIYFV